MKIISKIIAFDGMIELIYRIKHSEQYETIM